MDIVFPWFHRKYKIMREIMSPCSKDNKQYSSITKSGYKRFSVPIQKDLETPKPCTFRMLGKLLFKQHVLNFLV